MAEPGVKAYVRQREPGGRLPDIGKLLSATMGDFGDNIGPYGACQQE